MMGGSDLEPRRVLVSLALLAAVISAGCESRSIDAEEYTGRPTRGRVWEMESVESTPSPLYTSITRLRIPYPQCATVKRAAGCLYANVDAGVGYINRVVRVDPETLEDEVVVQSDNDVPWIAVSDRWLVWETNLHMYAQPVEGGERVQLGSYQEVYAPDIEGDTVAWMNRLADGTYQVTVRDLTEDDNRVLADLTLPCFYNNFIDLKDGVVLWTDVIDGIGRYRRCSVDGGAIEDFAMAGREYHVPGYALIHDDHRFFSVNFRNYEEWTWSDQEMGYYSVDTGQFTKMDFPGTYCAGLEVCGDTFGYLDQAQSLHLCDARDPLITMEMSGAVGELRDSVGAADDNTFWVGQFAETTKGAGTVYYLIKIP